MEPAAGEEPVFALYACKSADTWHWKGAASTFADLIPRRTAKVSEMLQAVRSFIGENQMMAVRPECYYQE
ncbi:MAG: hypothetical protein ACR2IH_01110 [Pyrinomonadaceae bacterium]